MNSSNQATKLICILDIIEKPLNFSLFFQWLEFLENPLQLPNNPCLSDSDLNLGECKLPFQFFSPNLFFGPIFRNRCAK